LYQQLAQGKDQLQAIVGLCFVLHNPNLVDADVLVATDRDKWASMFYDSAMVDYTIDDQN
jgi:hypothetical protein